MYIDNDIENMTNSNIECMSLECLKGPSSLTTILKPLPLLHKM